MRREIKADIASLTLELLAGIDQRAEKVRGLFITNTASQPSIYLEKEKEALAYVAWMANTSQPQPSTPNMDLEAVRTGETLYDVAVVILTQAETWRQISAVIEDRRLLVKDAVRSANPNVAAMRAAAIVDWSDIEAMAPPP